MSLEFGFALPALNSPGAAPSLNLNFLTSTSLDSRITFSRSSTATYYNSVGTLVSAAINVPRFDYNPSSFTFQNLLTQSQTFTTAAGWLITSLGFTTSNVAVAPDGTSTATLFDEGTDNSAHAARSPSPVPAVPVGYTYTASCYFKYVSRQWVILALSTATTSYASAKFDILNGVLGSTANSGSTFPSAGLSSSITAVGNGWYRCSITFNTTTTGTINLRVGMATDGTTFTAAERGLQVYTGTNRQVLVWGSQLSNTSTNLAYYATTTSAYTQCAPRGLLIEEQRSNAYLYSEDLTNAVWVAGDNTVTANAAVAPDGNSTADLLVPTTATTSHAFYQLASVTSGNTYTISLYAKAAGYSFINFYGSTGFDATQYINFSITSGTVSTSSGFTGTITSVGNGWYRCTVTAVSNATSASGRIVFRTYSATRTTASNSYTADGTSGAYIWGVQFELGAFASSYVPTTTAAATRSADIATMTGTNFSSWYNPIQWTMYSEYDVTWTGNSTIPAQTPYVFGIDNSANAGFNGYSMQENYQSNTARPRAVLRYSSTTTSLLITATTYATAGVVYKSIMAINSSEIAGTVNGQTTQTVSNPNYGLENLDQMRVGFGRSGGSSPYYINGHVRVLSYYPTRLSNGTLQTLTT